MTLMTVDFLLATWRLIDGSIKIFKERELLIQSSASSKENENAGIKENIKEFITLKPHFYEM